MEHIEAVTRDLVARIKNGDIPDTAFATVDAPCPKCGGVIQENYRKFQCQACDFNLWKVISGREWAPEEVAELITKRTIGPLTGFRSRMGRPFAAVLKLNDEQRIEFDFGQARPEDEGGEAPDFSTQQPLGDCPKCGARVYDSGMAYVCEKAVGSPRTCDFRSGKIILQQPIEREQMEKLLGTGKTDLLNRFISKKGRPFKAFLTKTPGGKIGFEFQARAVKPGAAPSKQAANDPVEAPAVPVKKAAAKTKKADSATKAKAKPSAKAPAKAKAKAKARKRAA
jgi:DNA topoisomerase-3